jgi:DNA-binding NarL/FixJ family response regulator
MHVNGTAFQNSNVSSFSAASERFPEKISPTDKAIMILDLRSLDGQCLARCFASQKTDMEFVAVTSVTEWRSVADDASPLAAILLNIGGKCADDPVVADQVRSLSAEFQVPVILLADSVDLLQIIKALEYGAKGYIPSSVSIDVCIEAIALSLAGGIFLPASSVLAMRTVLEVEAPQVRPLESMFTARQVEVVTALRLRTQPSRKHCKGAYKKYHEEDESFQSYGSCLQTQRPLPAGVISLTDGGSGCSTPNAWICKIKSRALGV